jgi:DNA polymerase III delta prime subunit
MKKIESAVSMNELDLNHIPPIVGRGSTKKFESMYAHMKHIRKPFLFTGPAGSGKTTFALNMLKRYSLEYGVPSFIVQVSPEMSKSTLVIGKQLREGSLVTVKGCVAVAAELGAGIFIDEAQQSSQELLATMQSLFERNAIITDSTEAVRPRDTFRAIFASNPSTSHAANVPLPQAFASRVIAVRFDYPSFEDEVEIAKAIAEDPEVFKLPLEIPEAVLRFVVGFMREHRSDYYPLSARNAAACVGYMNVEATLNGFSESMTRYRTMPQDELTRHVREQLGLSKDQNLEVFLTKMFERIYGKTPASTVNLTKDTQLRRFLEFLCAHSAEQLRNAVRATFMVDLDLDTSFHDVEAVKQRIVASILPP